MDFIHAHDHRGSVVGFKDLGKNMGIALHFQPYPAFLEVENPGICVRNALEQCGFSGLPRPKEQAYLTLRGIGLQYVYYTGSFTYQYKISYWVKFEAKRVEPSPAIPLVSGIR